MKLSDVENKAIPAITGVGVGPLDQTQLYQRAQFNAEEVRDLKESFENLDGDHNGAIDEKDLLNAMQKMGYAENENIAHNIMQEVDFGRKGNIEFHDFLEIAAGMKELHLDNAFTHLAGMDKVTHELSKEESIGEHANDSSFARSQQRQIPISRTGGGT